MLDIVDRRDLPALSDSPVGENADEVITSQGDDEAASADSDGDGQVDSEAASFNESASTSSGPEYSVGDGEAVDIALDPHIQDLLQRRSPVSIVH